MRSHSYLNTVKNVLSTYYGNMPLAAWLKQFFKQHKKYGSKDRKQITHLCYCYYRLGGAFNYLPLEDKIIIAAFLCSGTSNIVLQELKPEWNELITLPLNEKLNRLSAKEEINNIFPFANELSKEIDKSLFNRSFLLQPYLYLRIRPGRKEKLKETLRKAGVYFELIEENCVLLMNSTKVDEIIELDRDAVVQDLNSQNVIQPLQGLISADIRVDVWDCCAASGGKSILFHDHFPKAHLNVSDVRDSILVNLRNRFKRAGINNYDSFIADISSNRFSINKRFDVVICDAPCSGSGTWGRTPEQLRIFKREKIGYYADLQKNISTNAGKYVKKGGYFLYITCSVFQQENEEVVAYIQKSLPLQLVNMQYFKGYERKADTLFAALFSAL